MPEQTQINALPAGRPTILIVEDDVVIRSLLCTILEESGYRVRSAEDGFTALTQMRAEIPDILLSDLHMPGMSGFELLPVVRQQFPMVRIIAMSGAYTSLDVPDNVFADAFYPKGTNIGGLLQILATALPLDSITLSPSAPRLV
jgi:CheY-like chemotaxis protein